MVCFGSLFHGMWVFSPAFSLVYLAALAFVLFLGVTLGRRWK